MMATQNLAQENKIKIQEFNDQIGSLTAKAQANQEKLDEMTNKIEELETKLATQQMSELQLEFTSHKNQIDAKFAIEKLNVEFKLTAQKLVTFSTAKCTF